MRRYVGAPARPERCALVRPPWPDIDGRTTYRQVFVNYAPTFNGGLLLHGFGEVFAVELGGKVGWSVHT